MPQFAASPLIYKPPMNSSGYAGAHEQEPETVFTDRFIPITAGLAAIVLTYIAAMAGFGGWGIASVAGIAALFVAVCVLLPGSSRQPATAAATDEAPAVEQTIFDEIEDRLIALDEANEVFGTSLNAADMFRLVSSRIGEIFPLSAAALIVPGDSGGTLRFVHLDGMNSDSIRGTEILTSDGLAGSVFAGGRIEIDNDLTVDRSCLGAEKLAGFASSVAIPLIQDDVAFGVFQLFTEDRIESDDDTMKLLEAIKEHVTPIFRSSMAFERSLSSALTDSLTGLPNERAFYMVLENQLAESMRHRDDRPLTILSIDIRDFGAVNSMLGHMVGDRMLEFAGARIGEHLRKMDFLARTVNDEFSVILPTASEKVAFEIIERIRAGFAQNEFEIADGEGVTIALNIGWAAFWKDGETADQLLRAAQQRKREAKCEEPTGLLWFPKEYVN
jgi:diguanylate cyclase (GGDEF)-like protein